MQLKSIIEGALLAAGRPLTLADIGNLFEPDARPDNAELRAALTELDADCRERGCELREVSSGYRLQVKQELSPWIARLWDEKPARYSRALLETLTLIAYRQPITRGEIEDVRGVAVNPAIVRTLQEREWVRVVGQRDVPGRPELLATTRQFLDYFGLKSLEQLPTLAELKDLEQVDRALELEVGTDGAETTAPAAIDAVPDETDAMTAADGDANEAAIHGEAELQ
jgi:segregation and condensation protein B